MEDSPYGRPAFRAWYVKRALEKAAREMVVRYMPESEYDRWRRRELAAIMLILSGLEEARRVG